MWVFVCSEKGGGLSSLPEEAFQEAFWGGERRRRWEGVVGVFVQGLLFK